MQSTWMGMPKESGRHRRDEIKKEKEEEAAAAAGKNWGLVELNVCKLHIDYMNHDCHIHCQVYARRYTSIWLGYFQHGFLENNQNV